LNRLWYRRKSGTDRQSEIVAAINGPITHLLLLKGDKVQTTISQSTFVGLYFIDEERDETGHIIALISDGYYLAQFDSIEKGATPPRLEVLSSVEFNKLCDSCGSRHWRFFGMLRSPASATTRQHLKPVEFYSDAFS
jgi:hypothetical protein